MDLYVFRHGIAEDHAADGTDASRALTRKGVERTAQAAAGLATIAATPDAILTSPKVRAVQTAGIVGEALGVAPEVQDVLASGSAQDVLDMLSQRREVNVIIVGHEPVLSEVISLALGMRGASQVAMKKAGCACLTVNWSSAYLVTRAILHWHCAPAMLRQLGGAKD